MQHLKICTICGDEFVLRPNKPGKINECPDCAKPDTPRYMACVTVDGKTHSGIQITKDTAYATAFNNAQKRRGYGVVGGIVETKTMTQHPRAAKVRTTSSSPIMGGVKVNSSTKDQIQEHYTRR